MFRPSSRLLRFNFCFRFRKQWETHLMSKHHNILSFLSPLKKLQSQLIPSEKLLFFELLSKKNKLLQELLSTSPTLPLSLSNTPTNWFIFNQHNRFIKQQLQLNQLTLPFIHQSTLSIYTHLNQYLLLLKQFLINKPMIDKVRRRLMLFQQQICRLIIENYTEVKEDVNFETVNTKRTKFKEDIQYKIADLDGKTLRQLGDILRMFCHLGCVSKKMLLVVQLIMEKYVGKMGDELYWFLFVLAHHKAGVKVVENEIVNELVRRSLEIKQNEGTDEEYMNNVYALYYLVVNHLYQYKPIQTIIQFLNRIDTSFDYSLHNITQLRLVSYLHSWFIATPHRYPNFFMSFQNQNHLLSSIIPFYSMPSSQQQFFVKFIDKEQINYKIKLDDFFHKPCYVMSTNIFFFMDLRDVNMGNGETGLVYLGKEWYKNNKIKIKMINAAQTNKTETRRKEVEYFWSKVKKEMRGEKKKGGLYYEY